jgi:hypothetical protein
MHTILLENVNDNLVFPSTSFLTVGILVMGWYQDPYTTPVPEGHRGPSKSYNEQDLYHSQLLTATPRPQSNVRLFRQSDASNATTLVTLKTPLNRSSLKRPPSIISYTPISHPHTIFKKPHARPTTFPGDETAPKLIAHGHRFTVDFPINYQQLLRTFAPRQNESWPRSWLLKTPKFDSKIMVNPYYRPDSYVPLFQHSCATISSTSSKRSSGATYIDIQSIDTPRSYKSMNLEDTSDEHCIFSMQATLFALGFLLFPCWWIGGFYCRSPGRINKKARNWMSRSTWVLTGTIDKNTQRSELTYPQLFHVLNRLMAILSAVWLIVAISIIIWYYVGVAHGLWQPWDTKAVDTSRLDHLNRLAKMNIAT